MKAFSSPRFALMGTEASISFTDSRVVWVSPADYPAGESYATADLPTTRQSCFIYMYPPRWPRRHHVGVFPVAQSSRITVAASSQEYADDRARPYPARRVRCPCHRADPEAVRSHYPRRSCRGGWPGASGPTDVGG